MNYNISSPISRKSSLSNSEEKESAANIEEKQGEGKTGRPGITSKIDPPTNPKKIEGSRSSSKSSKVRLERDRESDSSDSELHSSIKQMKPKLVRRAMQTKLPKEFGKVQSSPLPSRRYEALQTVTTTTTTTTATPLDASSSDDSSSTARSAPWGMLPPEIHQTIVYFLADEIAAANDPVQNAIAVKALRNFSRTSQLGSALVENVMKKYLEVETVMQMLELEEMRESENSRQKSYIASMRALLALKRIPSSSIANKMRARLNLKEKPSSKIPDKEITAAFGRHQHVRIDLGKLSVPNWKKIVPAIEANPFLESIQLVFTEVNSKNESKYTGQFLRLFDTFPSDSSIGPTLEIDLTNSCIQGKKMKNLLEKIQENPTVVALSLKPNSAEDLQSIADLIGQTNVSKLSFPCYAWPFEKKDSLTSIIKKPSNLVSLDVGLLSEPEMAVEIARALNQNTQLRRVKLWVSDQVDSNFRLGCVEGFCTKLKSNNTLRLLEVRLPYTIPATELANLREKFDRLKRDLTNLSVEYSYFSSLWH